MKTATATLDQLKLNPEINPRHVAGKGIEGLEGMIAQIRHKGLISHIWVRPSRKGAKTFDIIDGGRRYRSLQFLAKAGEWKKSEKILITVFDCNVAEAQDLALVANFEREALSPADEAIGFTRLAKSGMKVEDIAAHYAVTPKLVNQRIAIGSLPAPILAALRETRIDLRAAQEFTSCSPEHALKTFKALEKKKSLDAWDVERALRDDSVAGNDRRCFFVGEAAYEAAGGVINRDLFSDTSHWTDEKLLDTLFEAKIETEAQALKDEGWSFVEVMRKNTHQLNTWGRSAAPEKRELTKEEKAELKDLKQQHKDLCAEAARLSEKEQKAELSDDEDERQVFLEDEVEDVAARIKAFDQPVYTDRQKKKAGAVIAYDEQSQYGRVEIHRGLLKPSAKANAKPKAGESEDGEGLTAVESANYSDAIVADLGSSARNATKLAMVTRHQGAAYRMGLTARILAAIGRKHDAPFYVSHDASDKGAAYAALRAEALKPFGFDPAADEDDFDNGEEDDTRSHFAEAFNKVMKLEGSELDLVEAILAADLFRIHSLKNPDVVAVLTEIDPDMAAEGWKPDAAFMGRLNRAQLTAVISDCDPTFKTPAAWKKSELVDEASGRALATGWLPPQLRTPTYKGPGSNAWAEQVAAKSADEIAHQQAAE